MLYAKHESDRLGSDWTIITHLKTVRAFKKTILDSYAHPGVWIIYFVPREKWYSETGHTEVARVTKHDQTPTKI